MGSATEERILDAARRVLCANPAATIDDIAASARVGRATVFRLFGNRAGLLKALARLAIDVTGRRAADAVATAPTATAALRLAIAAVVGECEHYRFLAMAADLSEDPEIAGAYDRQLSRLAELVVAARREGGIRAEIPTAWAVAMIDGQVWAAGNAVATGAVGLLQAQELVWETTMAGISTAAPRQHADGG